MIKVELIIKEDVNKQVGLEVARITDKPTKKEQLVNIVVEMQLKDILSNFIKKEREEI